MEIISGRANVHKRCLYRSSSGCVSIGLSFDDDGGMQCGGCLNGVRWRTNNNHSGPEHEEIGNATDINQGKC